MIFRQLFDSESSTYTYLLASRRGGDALIIDAVLGRVDHYLRLLKEFDLKLVKVVDTHIHADHVTGMGALRDQTRCVTVMGASADVDVVSMRVEDGDQVLIEGLALDVIHTPGHTDDSYSFLFGDRVFTGDTLMIRGTGRTDFQNGSPYDQYESLFNKLLKLPEYTLVYPAHDYKGDTVSSIGEERAFNPRLQVSSADEYAEIMNNLNLDYPKQIDVAVPANRTIGLDQGVLQAKGWAVEVHDVQANSSTGILVDLRERCERTRDGEIPGSLHAPYRNLEENLEAGGLLTEVARATGKTLILYCSYGEVSAMAVDFARSIGRGETAHLSGGFARWREAGGSVSAVA